MIQLDFEARFAVALQDSLSPEEVARAISGGLNRAATSIRVRLVRGLTEEVNLKTSYLRDVMPIRRASRDNLEAIITIQGRDVPLIEYAINRKELEAFKRDSTKALIAPLVQFRKGGEVKEYEKTFLVGQWGALIERKGPERIPLQGKYGPSLAQQGARIQATIADEARELVQKEIRSAIRGQLARAFPK